MALSSSAFASNCKVVAHSDSDVLTAGLTKVLTEHGYTVSDDTDSEYTAIGMTGDYEDGNTRIETEIKLLANNRTEIAYGVGKSRFPLVLIALQLCDEDEDCLARKYNQSIRRALRSFSRNLEVCR